MNTAAQFVATFCALLFVGTNIRLNGQTSRPAEPIEPIRAVLDALQTHQVVGLGTGAHNNEQGHAFLLALIRDRRFPLAGADLVVECGTARYQDVMDRFIAGDDVPHDALRRAWQDTTQPHSGCDVPLHEQIYQTVRAQNAGRPATQRVRVLLGDPAVDWDSDTLKQERGKVMAMRDSHPAQVIQQEVLGKKRRALVVYGQMHLQRKQMASNYDMSHPLAQTIVSLLEREGVKVFTVWGNTRADLETLQPGVASWPRPTLALTRGTVFGAADFDFFYASPLSRIAVTDGKLTPVPRDQWLSLQMEDQFDAVLYLGPPSNITIAEIPLSHCRDAAYMTMRLGRLEAYGPQAEADRLRKHCAEALK